MPLLTTMVAISSAEFTVVAALQLVCQCLFVSGGKVQGAVSSDTQTVIADQICEALTTG
jgi:hypothetical protein